MRRGGGGWSGASGGAMSIGTSRSFLSDGGDASVADSEMTIVACIDWLGAVLVEVPVTAALEDVTVGDLLARCLENETRAGGCDARSFVVVANGALLEGWRTLASSCSVSFERGRGVVHLSVVKRRAGTPFLSAALAAQGYELTYTAASSSSSSSTAQGTPSVTVHGLCIRRVGAGSVTWLEPVTLPWAACLDDAVQIEAGDVCLRPAAPRGDARLLLCGIWSDDRSAQGVAAFARDLEAYTTSAVHGRSFVYDGVRGEWSFVTAVTS